MDRQNLPNRRGFFRGLVVFPFAAATLCRETAETPQPLPVYIDVVKLQEPQIMPALNFGNGDITLTQSLRIPHQLFRQPDGSVYLLERKDG